MEILLLWLHAKMTNSLIHLQWSACNDKNMDRLSRFTNLTELNLQHCRKLNNTDILSSLTKLTRLNLHCCSRIYNVNGLESLTALSELDLSNCKSV
jgi:hypothetical protein